MLPDVLKTLHSRFHPKCSSTPLLCSHRDSSAVTTEENYVITSCHLTLHSFRVRSLGTQLNIWNSHRGHRDRSMVRRRHPCANMRPNAQIAALRRCTRSSASGIGCTRVPPKAPMISSKSLLMNRKENFSMSSVEDQPMHMSKCLIRGFQSRLLVHTFRLEFGTMHARRGGTQSPTSRNSKPHRRRSGME